MKVTFLKKVFLNMTEKVRTFIKHSAFLKGALRIIDLTGNISREEIRHAIHTRSSRDAIAGDWLNVGNDIKTAMNRYKREAIHSK